MGNIFSRIRREVHDVVRNCRARDEEEDVKTIISDYSTLERDRRKCSEKSPTVNLKRFDSDTGEQWKSMGFFASPTQSQSSPCIEDRLSKTDISSVCSTPLIVPGRISLIATTPSSRENSNYSLNRELCTLSDESDEVEIFTKAGLRARYTLSCPDKESIHENMSQKELKILPSEPVDSVETIEKRQEEVLKRLGVLQNRVGQLQEKYDIKSSSAGRAAATPTVMEPGKLHDIVIKIDPSSIPYSLLILYEQLRQQFKVLATTHVHSSVSNVPDNLKNIFQNDLIQSRKDYQIGLTVIWIKVKNGPVLMVNPIKQSAIEGEVNIARYLQRLLDSSYDTGDIIQATQIDEWLDVAQIQFLNGSNKERAGVMRSLNARFGKGDWLVGNQCSLADITMWSALHQAGTVDCVPANVKKWLTACGAATHFSRALKYVQ